jgi:hypothetical protein
MYEEQRFISNGSGGWEVQDQGTERFPAASSPHGRGWKERALTREGIRAGTCSLKNFVLALIPA